MNSEALLRAGFPVGVFKSAVCVPGPDSWAAVYSTTRNDWVLIRSPADARAEYLVAHISKDLKKAGLVPGATVHLRSVWNWDIEGLLDMPSRWRVTLARDAFPSLEIDDGVALRPEGGQLGCAARLAGLEDLRRQIERLIDLNAPLAHAMSRVALARKSLAWLGAHHWNVDAEPPDARSVPFIEAMTALSDDGEVMRRMNWPASPPDPV